MGQVSSYQTHIIPQNRLLPGILGLRGMAALAVVLFHLIHLGGLPVPDSFSFIARDFGKGVHLFFVLSAFSLMHSTEHTMGRATWVSEYFVKRFFRIAPLYYSIMAIMVFWPVLRSGVWSVDAEAVLLNLTFTFGFTPWKGIVLAGWSVGVEMLFYVVFPILLLTIRTRVGALVLVAICLLVGQVARTVLDAHFANTMTIYQFNWGYFTFAANIGFFALGVYAYRVVHTVDCDAVMCRIWLPAATLLLLGVLLFTNISGILRTAWHANIVLWGFVFALLSIWQSARPGRWSANRVFEYLGERSYSLYLLHPILMIKLKPMLHWVYSILSPYLGASSYFACAAFFILLLSAASEVTYRIIELPFIQFGKRITAKMRSAQTPSLSHTPG
jgi:peptidoglycan/LPS O-acetylase OafA/YrhL